MFSPRIERSRRFKEFNSSIAVDLSWILKCSSGTLWQSRFTSAHNSNFSSWLKFQFFPFLSESWCFLIPFFSSPNTHNFQAVRVVMIRLRRELSIWPNSCRSCSRVIDGSFLSQMFQTFYVFKKNLILVEASSWNSKFQLHLKKYTENSATLRFNGLHRERHGNDL